MTTTDITPLAILKQTRETLSDPEHWIKGEYNLINNDGTRCFCLDGALMAAPELLGHEKFWQIREGESYASWGVARNIVQAVVRPRTEEIEGLAAFQIGHIPTFNDHPDTTHADVLAVLDEAIAKVSA